MAKLTIDEAIEYLQDQDVSVSEVTAKWHVHSNEDWTDDGDEQLIDCHFWSDDELIKFVEEIRKSNGDDEDDEAEDEDEEVED